MKKNTKKWSVYILALILTLMLFPTNIFAAWDGQLVVNGKNILNETYYTVTCGDGKAIYDPTTQTLTLENAKLDESFDMGPYYLHRMIDNSTNHSITINLVGDNIIGARATSNTGYRIWSAHELIITGEGSLTIHGGNACIYANQQLTIDGANIKFYGFNDFGLASVHANVVIKNGSNITGENCFLALVTDDDFGGGIEIIDSQVKVSASCNAIYTALDNIMIQNSTVEATSSFPAFFANDITIIDSKIDTVSTDDRSIWAKNDLLIQGKSTVTAQGNPAGLGAHHHFTLIPSQGEFVDVYIGKNETDATLFADIPLSNETDMSPFENPSIKYFHSEPHAHTFNQQVIENKYLAEEATCEKPTSYYYSCRCTTEGIETFINGQELGHHWSSPVWNWSDDYKDAIVTFVCQNDSSHVETVTSQTINTVHTEDGKIIYTASVIYDGKTYTDEKIVAIATTNPSVDDTKIPETSDNSYLLQWIILFVTTSAILLNRIIENQKKKYNK